MAISASQKAALEAAGYTVSKNGRSVQNKSGGTVGGINANGELFGSGKALSILKSGGAKPAAKAAPKAAAKPAPKTAAPAKAKPKSKPKPKAKAEPRPKAKPEGKGAGTSSKSKAVGGAFVPAAKYRPGIDGPYTPPPIEPVGYGKASAPMSPTPGRAYAPAADREVKRGRPTSEGRAALAQATHDATKARNGNYTKSEWEAMTPAQRKAKGLSSTKLGSPSGFRTGSSKPAAKPATSRGNANANIKKK